jgi:hypothetical protein
MSDDVSALRALLPAYAGHEAAQARRLSDQQVRAFTGELLVDLQDRVPLDGIRERFDALLMRCEFGDQHVIKALEDDRFAEPEMAAAIEARDRTLVEAAAVSRTVAADGLETCIGNLERAFDERATAVAALLKR